jgi:4-alpha-glucanotransferase
LFAPAGVGAPPDDFFAGGQSWGFPPLHPERLRVDGYRYLIDAYRRVLSRARAIRIDHVLGLQRMFWIPNGAAAADGAYVRYPTEELRAVVAIEASRAGAVVVGEDLGVVSPSIRHAMDRDHMLHSFVYQFNATAKEPLPQPRKPSAASFGGHDLPKFASYWRGTDIDERLERGEIDATAAASDRRDRDALVAAVSVASRTTTGDDDLYGALHTTLGALADGPASYLFVDLADLTLETVPDNRPGTGPEAGNWRRRNSRTLADIAADPTVIALMNDLVARRAAVVGKE